MKLLSVRHGDPDYEIDSLTEKGWKETEYLSERLSRLNVKEFCISPLGRAKDELPAFAGRFCEAYDNSEERHD